MTDSAKIDIGSLFESDNAEGIDFELAVSAFLATILIYLSTDFALLNYMADLTAFSLLLLTIGRQLSLKSPFANRKKIMNVSMFLIEFLILFAVLYTGLALAEAVNSILMSLIGFEANLALLNILISLIIYGCIFLIIELVFRDLMMYLCAKIYNKGVESSNTIVKNLLTSIAVRGFEVTPYDRDYIEDTDNINPLKYRLGVFMLLIVLLALTLVPYLILGSFHTAILFVLLSYLVSGSVTLPYYRYGYSDYEDLMEGPSRKIINIVIPVFAIAFLLVVEPSIASNRFSILGL